MAPTEYWSGPALPPLLLYMACSELFASRAEMEGRNGTRATTQLQHGNMHKKRLAPGKLTTLTSSQLLENTNRTDWSTPVLDMLQQQTNGPHTVPCHRCSAVAMPSLHFSPASLGKRAQGSLTQGLSTGCLLKSTRGHKPHTSDQEIYNSVEALRCRASCQCPFPPHVGA